MLERPPVITFEVALTSIVEPDRVNIDFAPTLVAENEAHRDATRLTESVLVKNTAHPGYVIVSHDEVEVVVLTRLLADQCVHTPAPVQPDSNVAVIEPPENLHHIASNHRHDSQATTLQTLGRLLGLVPI